MGWQFRHTHSWGEAEHQAEQHKLREKWGCTKTAGNWESLETYSSGPKLKLSRFKSFGGFFGSLFLFLNFLPQLKWIPMLAPPAVAPRLQTWWWMTLQGASSPIRCSRSTATRTEQTVRPAKAGRTAVAWAVRANPDLSSARKRCKIRGWKLTVEKGRGCMIWTRRWMASERSCHTHMDPRSASCQRFPPCSWLAITSSCFPALWRRWRNWLGTFMVAMPPSRAAQLPIPPLPLRPRPPTSLCILWPSPFTLWWAAHLQLFSITHLLPPQPQLHTPLHQPASWAFTLQSRASWRTLSTWAAPTDTSPACRALAHSASLCPPLPPHYTACLWASEQVSLKIDCPDHKQETDEKKIYKMMAGAKPCTYCIYTYSYLLGYKLLLFFLLIASFSFLLFFFYRSILNVLGIFFHQSSLCEISGDETLSKWNCCVWLAQMLFS